MGWITAGLGLASSLFGERGKREQTNSVNQGFDYMKSNPLMQQAQQQGGEAMGLRGALLGLGGDTAAADAGFQRFQDSTGFNFRMDRGMGAITGSRAAAGILNSGASSKALMQFGQDLGSQEFEKYLGQLGQTTEAGLEAAGATGSAGGQAGAAAAEVQAKGDQNVASGIGGLVKGIGSIFGF